MYPLKFRRNALLAAILSTPLLLAGCGGSDDNSNNTSSSADTGSDNNADTGSDTAKTMSFETIQAPKTDAGKRLVQVSPTVTVNGEGSTLDYYPLARTGNTYSTFNGGSVTFGQLIDKDGNPLLGGDGNVEVSDNPDFTSLMEISDRLFSITQIEAIPGAFFLSELEQNKDTGMLTLKSMKQLDQSPIRGGWDHCAGSVTPWNTHLASEEYEPDASKIDASGHIDSYYDSIADYFNGDLTAANPYDYGWNIEVKVSADGNAEPTAAMSKRFAMGRAAIELANVMPDQKTAYISDDGTNVGFYMFVADTAGDLSAGTLYALKWNQTSADDQGSADIDWVSLGHATDDEIRPYVEGADKLTFADLFDTETPNAGGSCTTTGFKAVNVGDAGNQCLKLKSGMEKAASRLETRRYAAYMGATTELRKEEGVTLDPDRMKLYVAISEIQKGMEDDASQDLGGNNDIKVPRNDCGGIYQYSLGTDADIGSDYVAQSVSGLVAGKAGQSAANADYSANNSCDIDGIANPDNISYLPGYNILVIGEDSGGGHQNDAIWAYNVGEDSLTRIETTPYGSENTSVDWYPDINGWGYLTGVIQHPYGETDTDENTGNGEAHAYVGYFGPFPSLK